uniref:Serine/threonine-protein phosphatase 7 long form homolog n=1 Tax=Nicotiana tabacum TaxID=4097 RepID=A0A1S3Z2P4_TOBAC|nr:PREDICTED: serine/threonine-protein phosphatase 7 long form homolog [Nicotiana tabacum]
MLQDVEILYGLQVDGLVVALLQGMRDYMRAQYLETLQRLTNFRPKDEAVLVGASCISLTPIRQYLEAMHDDIAYDTPEVHINQYTRLLLLLMFGGVLFPNTPGNLINLRFLYHLEQLDDLPQYSWGVIVLGYLYRQMCWACMGTQRDVVGFMSLLQFQPLLPPIAQDAPPLPFLPLSRRWVERRGYGRE